MISTRNVSTMMAWLVLAAAALSMTGCAADAEPDPTPAPKEIAFSGTITEPAQDTNQAPQAPPPAGATDTTATTPTGAPLTPSQPRITPKK